MSKSIQLPRMVQMNSVIHYINDFHIIKLKFMGYMLVVERYCFHATRPYIRYDTIYVYYGLRYASFFFPIRSQMCFQSEIRF